MKMICGITILVFLASLIYADIGRIYDSKQQVQYSPAGGNNIVLSWGGAASEWTLADVTNSPFWFDASVSTSITLNGIYVSTWSSMNSTNAGKQGTAANQPQYVSNALNNLNIINFDGTNDLIQNIGDYYATNYSIFVVARTASATKQQTLLGKYQSGGRELYLAITNNFLQSVFNTNGVSVSYDRNALSTNTIGAGWVVVGAVKNGTNVTMSVNGATNTVAFSDSAVYNGNLNMMVGGGVLSSAYLGGDIAEVIYIQHALSDVDRQKVEGAMAWKWGLQTNLVPYQPYVSVRPTK